MAALVGTESTDRERKIAPESNCCARRKCIENSIQIRIVNCALQTEERGKTDFTTYVQQSKSLAQTKNPLNCCLSWRRKSKAEFNICDHKRLVRGSVHKGSQARQNSFRDLTLFT